MGKGFEINKRGIAKMAEELEKEFAKHPIKVPLEADSSGVAYPLAGSTNYYGPVVQVNGDHAQLAWDNDSVTQNQSHVEQIAPGYEAIAEALVRTLQSVDALDLPESEREQIDCAAKEVLAEVTKPAPERSIVERGVNAVKGLLSGVALGITAGVTQESKELAVQVIEQISQAM